MFQITVNAYFGIIETDGPKDELGESSTATTAFTAAFTGDCGDCTDDCDKI
jgi:hypothetical protein